MSDAFGDGAVMFFGLGEGGVRGRADVACRGYRYGAEEEWKVIWLCMQNVRYDIFCARSVYYVQVWWYV